MQTRVTFRHMKSSPELKELAQESSEKFEKFSDEITSGDFVFVNEGPTQKIVEFTVQVNGNTLVVKEDSDDFVKSLKDGADKMIRQIKKWKTKNGKS